MKEKITFSRQRFFQILLFLTLGAFSQGRDRPHVLFLAVDDLRPQLSCYGEKQMVSPHIDQLAGEGVLFREAYCQVPTCGASRASMLTGLWPNEKRFLNYRVRAEVDAPGVIDLPGWLKQQGYHTVSLGKVYHHADDNESSWDEIYRPKGHNQYFDPKNIALVEAGGRGAAFEAPDVPVESLHAGKMAAEAVRQLRMAQEKGQSLFLAVGFTKPHLPFIATKKYWDLYDPEAIELADNPFLPKDAPPEAAYNWGELRAYDGVPKEGPVSDELNRKLVHGYYACVSQTDAMIGRILRELDALGMRKNTIVVLWSDHGWQLGEHGFWCKHVTFRTSLRIPLIISAPGMEAGKESTGLVAGVDIFPTLCDLLGMEKPDHLQGASFARLLKDPSLPGKAFTYSRHGNRDAIRTGKYLYSEFRRNGEVVARMLYDQEKDPDENFNISELPENRGLVDHLSRMLAEQIEFVNTH